MSLFNKFRLTCASIAAIAAVGLAAPGAAQSSDDAGVVVFNESLHELRVYAFHPDQEVTEGELLGWVGHEELEFFRVPDAASMDGSYRIAVQEITPMPQIGVSAAANPRYASEVLSPEADETVRITVSPDMELSEIVVR